MKKIATVIIFMLLLQANTAYTNGGPVAWTELSPFNNLSVKPVQEDSISLQKEDLNITVTGFNTYHVNAEYYLVSESPREVTFGVPITGDIGAFSEYGIGGGMFETIEECLAYRRELYSYGKVVGYETYTEEECKKDVQSYAPEFKKYRQALMTKAQKVAATISITLNGNAEPCSVVDPTPYSHKYSNELNFISKTKAWCVTSKLRLNAKTNKITMEYEGQFDYDDMIFTKSPLTKFSDRKLSYYFSPAGYWKGSVANVNINLDLGPYVAFANVISPAGFKIDNNRVVWSLSNVDFDRLRKIEIEFPSRVISSNELGSWNKLAPEYLRIDLQAKASSALQSNRGITYAPNNITDGKMDTAWCEGAKGDGEGQWVEVIQSPKKFEDYCHLYGIAITPGYLKSQKTYLNNARIRKIRISKCDQTLGDVFDIPLSDNYMTAPYLIRNRMEDGAWEKFITEYRRKHGNDYTHPDYNPPKEILDFIKTSECFKVEILEVEKGIFEDSCISEISIVMNCG
jgi:hypothetical protein